jgi:hypothetical protein
MLQKIRFFDKKPPTLSISELLSWMTIFKSIQMAFYVNPSWACTLFRTNKQHVVLGQKWKCQRVEQMQDICRGSVGPLPLDGANLRKCYASNLTLKWQRFCLIIVDRFPLCWPLKIWVCLPRKYVRFMLLIDNNLLLPGAKLHILIKIYRKWS